LTRARKGAFQLRPVRVHGMLRQIVLAVEIGEVEAPVEMDDTVVGPIVGVGVHDEIHGKTADDSIQISPITPYSQINTT
jgi:hypothetical protein